MKSTEQERLSQFIAEEMRQVCKGSFPLSPGLMDGHYAVANLYWYFRQEILENESVLSIFGRINPDPPLLQLPRGHREVSIGRLNSSVWNSFIETAFTSRPEVVPQTEVRDLLSINASSDSKNFTERLQGEKSQIVMNATPTPSLLRAFLYEDGFPEKNLFFTKLFVTMRQEVALAAQQNFKDGWSRQLGILVKQWNNHFPQSPFIPKE